MPELKAKHVTALRRAVAEASSWRGSLIGHPDEAEMLAEFDEFIATATEAVKVVAELRKSARKDAERLDFIERDKLEIDSCGSFDERPAFGVSTVTGGRNDRNWKELGRGDTVREAIDEAMKHKEKEK